MRVRDIVNREIVNLTNCEHEPIHIPGSIQPHGFLLGLKADGLQIDFCSGNSQEYIGMDHRQLLGNTFASVFGSENRQLVDNYIAANLMLSSTPLSLTLNDSRFLCTLHKSNDSYILEAEPETPESKTLPDTYEQTKQFLSYMSRTASLQQLCSAVAKGTREITGYDRVMIYRFDEEYNGEVFAEAVREDLEPFLGLFYPHTDIPVQARALYMKNLLRLISDINYVPVPIYTIDDSSDKNLDLSFSVLRSTSPIHVQYLQNMGVGATLTISLIHNNKLWGLIACHHYSVKVLPHPMRIAAQLQGHFITSQIDVRQRNEEYDVTKRSNEALEKLLAINFRNVTYSFHDMVNNKLIQELCNATGISIIASDILFKAGKTPDEEVIRGLAPKLLKLTRNKGFHTTHLASHIPGAEQYADVAAGVIYHSLSINSNDCIMWFRGETQTEVHWGGDPAKAIIKDENGLHPRKSFDLWKELVKHKSKPWLQPELNSAATLAHTFEKHVTLLTITEEERKYRELSEVLKASNEELENVNWISTHDLQEPLRKIQLMASRILASEDNLPPKPLELVKKMNESANKMQILLRDILNYTRIKYTEDELSVVSLNDVLTEVQGELDENIKEKSASLVIKDLPKVKGIPFLLKQLFINLVNNSLKFSAQDRPQLITVEAVPTVTSGEGMSGAEQYHLVRVTDTGIGFEPQYAESIFKIFTRLHSGQQYQGSGVGLALCKKIMQSHNGHITASGKPGEGAVFNLYFPV